MLEEENIFNKQKMHKIIKNQPKFEIQQNIQYYLPQIEKSFKKPLQSDHFSQAFRTHFIQTCQAISSFRQLNKENNCKQQGIFLGERSPKHKKTIIFDLDETIIHCTGSIFAQSDAKITINFPNGTQTKVGINIRPHALDILKKLSQRFELIIFTASHKLYAESIIAYLDPEREYIKHIFCREQCLQSQIGIFIKDLSIFRDRKLSEIVLVDNTAFSYAFQIENGIPILPFYDNKEDKELVLLMGYLRAMEGVEDVREFNRKMLKMAGFVSDYQKAFENLFKKKCS